MGSREERIQAGSREIGSINFKGYARNVILKVKFSLDNKYSRVIFIGNAHINLVVNSPGEALLGRAVKPNVDSHDDRRRYPSSNYCGSMITVAAMQVSKRKARHGNFIPSYTTRRRSDPHFDRSWQRTNYADAARQGYFIEVRCAAWLPDRTEWSKYHQRSCPKCNNC